MRFFLGIMVVALLAISFVQAVDIMNLPPPTKELPMGSSPSQEADEKNEQFPSEPEIYQEENTKEENSATAVKEEPLARTPLPTTIDPEPEPFIVYKEIEDVEKESSIGWVVYGVVALIIVLFGGSMEWYLHKKKKDAIIPAKHFVSECRRRGIDDITIRRELLMNNWTQKEVSRAIAY